MARASRTIRPLAPLFLAQLLGLLALVLAALPVLASEPTFPELSGRVVDAADILPADRRAALEARLKAYEEKTSDQVVVATVPSLQGATIEDFGNRLFRHWKLGQAKTNNGVLLLVAPTERKVRIEVGYGLEGALTDALSRVIIAGAITPRFKEGDYAGGVAAGVDGILSILSKDAEEWQRRPEVREDRVDPVQVALFVVLFLVVLFVVWRTNRGGRRGGIVVLPGPVGGGWSGGTWGDSSSGGFGGGFSGGGGSSGGGGASGGW